MKIDPNAIWGFDKRGVLVSWLVAIEVFDDNDRPIGVAYYQRMVSADTLVYQFADGKQFKIRKHAPKITT